MLVQAPNRRSLTPPAARRARLRDIQGSRAELCDMGLPGAVYARWDIGREWVERHVERTEDARWDSPTL